MTIDEFGPHVEALNHFMAASNEQHKGVYHSREWVAAYCSLYARCAWEEVGGFDPIYKNGCEDLDHCIRLRRAGYEIGEAFDAFIFHAGGISRGSYQAENRESYRKEDEYNHRVKDAKWGKKKIGIYTGPGWEKWTRETVDAGMGGSETWAAELAAEFSRRGHQVFLFGDCQEPHIDRDGVAYIPHQEMEDTLLYDWLDVLICSRTVEPVRKKNLHASQVWVMIHDVFISQDPKVHEKVDWRIKGYAYLSDWHKDFLIQHHGLNPAKMWLTMNGVNSGLYDWRKFMESSGYHFNPPTGYWDFQGLGSPKKNQSVYSSSPDRGLLQLLQILPEIREVVPDFKLLVAYGFHNWESAAKQRNNPQEMAHIAEIKRLMNQPGVEYLGRIDKKTLARHQMQSKVWLYPTWFSETFCITAVENGLAKNAIVSTDLAGLQTTVGKAGILVPWEGQYTEKYLRTFVAHAVQVLLNDQLLPVWANNVYEKAKEYTWQAAADGWERQFGWKR